MLSLQNYPTNSMQRVFLTFATVLLCLTIFNIQVSGQEPEDSVIFHTVITGLSAPQEATTAERMIRAASMLLGTPYVAGTLEQVPERLIVNLHETDCILFAETCLALALTSKEADASFSKFAEILQRLRYRNGIIDGYSSRLHYTSEWIMQGEKNGFLHEISRDLGHTPSGQKFFFMSTHPQSYRQLSGNPQEVEKIKKIEKELNGHTYFYIPKAQVSQCLDKIKPGDIIGFNTSVAGLDMTHVGIVYTDNGRLTFIHASASGKKVLIEPGGIPEYINKIKSNNGIRIIRPM